MRLLRLAKTNEIKKTENFDNIIFVLSKAIPANYKWNDSSWIVGISNPDDKLAEDIEAKLKGNKDKPVLIIADNENSPKAKKFKQKVDGVTGNEALITSWDEFKKGGDSKKKDSEKPKSKKDYEIYENYTPLNVILCFGDRKLVEEYKSLFQNLPFTVFMGDGINKFDSGVEFKDWDEVSKYINKYKFKRPYVLNFGKDAEAQEMAANFGTKALSLPQFIKLEKILPRVVRAYGELVSEGCRSYGLSTQSLSDDEKSKKEVVLKFEDDETGKKYVFKLPLKGSDVGWAKLYKESSLLGLATMTRKIGEIQYMEDGNLKILPELMGSHVVRLLEEKK